MNRCLCCGKEIEEGKLWHDSCLRKFFGTSKLPSLQFDKDENGNVIRLFENKSSITGVQRKMSLGLSQDRRRLTLFDFPLGYIIKPEIGDIQEIARSEHLTMSLANIAGIQTAPHALLKDDDIFVYITKRIDRNDNEKIHMEDMCQLSNKITEYKYDGSYEKLGKLIFQFTKKQADIAEFYYRILFCLITGNSDMHLKNFSIIENNDIILSPAYDLVPVNVIFPSDKEETALTINGKKKNITKNDLLKLGESIGLDKKICVGLMKRICSFEDRFLECIQNSFLNEETKIIFINLIKARISRLKLQ